MGTGDKPFVLVVDDDEDVRTLAIEMLASRGYEALGASGAFEAIRLLAEYEVDVLFTDIAMPGLSGIALARHARRLKPGLRVVYTTGFVPPEEWDEERYGRVVRKPYLASHLTEEIERALND